MKSNTFLSNKETAERFVRRSSRRSVRASWDNATTLMKTILALGLAVWVGIQGLQIARLQEENRELKSRLQTLESDFRCFVAAHTDGKAAPRTVDGSSADCSQESATNVVVQRGEQSVVGDLSEVQSESKPDERRAGHALRRDSRLKNGDRRDRVVRDVNQSNPNASPNLSLEPSESHQGIDVPWTTLPTAILRSRHYGSYVPKEKTLKIWDIDTIDGMHYDQSTGHIKVLTPGKYYVYSQLFFGDNSAEQCGYFVCVNDVKQQRSVVSMGGKGKQTVDLVGVFHFNANDKISIQKPDVGPSCKLHLEPLGSFFGVILLERESQVDQLNPVF